MDLLPLDVETYAKVRKVLRSANWHGQDAAEALHRADLLLTPARDKLIRLQAMNYLLGQIINWEPYEFLRRKVQSEYSPTDMYRIIIEFIEDHISYWEREQ